MKIIAKIVVLCSLFLLSMIASVIIANGEEQALLLKYKTLTIETKQDHPITDFTLSIADINKDKKMKSLCQAMDI
jgi:hypothetical protein